MTYQQLWQRLTPLYDAGEARAIVRTVLEERFGLTMTDLLCDGLQRLNPDQQQSLRAMIERLCKAEPVQYVLGEASFLHRTMHVEPGVLIPRPETEELCKWILDAPHPTGPQIIDIGCGSGCIAITLALGLPQARVVATDISERALDITRVNAARHQAKVEVERRDALAMGNDKELWDIIVSNPPYICMGEQKDMHPNVTRYEPHEALFVPDTAPLLFYRAISQYGTNALRHGGALYFECNTAMVQATGELLKEMRYAHVETRPDQFGRPRFIKAIRP